MAIFEVLNNQQSYFNRYFRRNVGDDDYATHSSVTVDRIVMDVNPSAGNGNTGLPTGAPTVTDSVMQTIDFAYSGTISELYRNGSDYFKGIIANVKYYLSGELIHSWSINSNSSTESDSVGGLVLTIINGNAADWGLFDRQADGDWLGSYGGAEFITSVPVGGPALTQYTLLIANIGSRYLISVDVSNYLGTGTVGVVSGGGIPEEDRSISSNGNIEFVFVATSSFSINLFSKSSNQCDFSNISVKEVLKNA